MIFTQNYQCIAVRQWDKSASADSQFEITRLEGVLFCVIICQNYNAKYSRNHSEKKFNESPETFEIMWILIFPEVSSE